jgi:hypothetical protein
MKTTVKVTNDKGKELELTISNEEDETLDNYDYDNLSLIVRDAKGAQKLSISVPTAELYKVIAAFEQDRQDDIAVQEELDEMYSKTKPSNAIFVSLPPKSE